MPGPDRSRPHRRAHRFAVLVGAHRRDRRSDGIELLERDLQPAVSEQRAGDAAVRPLPSELTTPPVTKMYFISNVFPARPGPVPRAPVLRHVRPRCRNPRSSPRSKSRFPMPRNCSSFSARSSGDTEIAPAATGSRADNRRCRGASKKQKRRQLFGSRTTGGIAQIRNRATRKI